jgi:hypothetical protein
MVVCLPKNISCATTPEKLNDSAGNIQVLHPTYHHHHHHPYPRVPSSTQLQLQYQLYASTNHHQENIHSQS